LDGAGDTDELTSETESTGLIGENVISYGI